MPRPSRLLSAFRKRLQALGQTVSGALAGDVVSVHQFRVATRRLREALPVLDVAPDDARDDPHSPGRLSRRVRRLTRALGGVRELDVALALLDEFALRLPELAGPAAILRPWLESERDGRRPAMLKRLSTFEPGALALRVAVHVACAERNGSDAYRRRRLSERLKARMTGLARALTASGLMYAPHRLHPVRIAAKKLRYALELAREFHGVPALALTRRLKAAQDLLGSLHDREMLIGYARSAMLDPARSIADRAEIERLAQAIEADVLRLHSEFLRMRPVLQAVLARCRTVVLPRLRHGPDTVPPRAAPAPPVEVS